MVDPIGFDDKDDTAFVANTIMANRHLKTNCICKWRRFATQHPSIKYNFGIVEFAYNVGGNKKIVHWILEEWN